MNGTMTEFQKDRLDEHLMRGVQVEEAMLE